MDRDDVIWQKISKAIFGSRPMADEGLFTFRVMEQIRALQPALDDVAWHQFLHWAVPMLGMAAACLIFAARAPSIPLLMDQALFHQQSSDAGTLSAALEQN